MADETIGKGVLQVGFDREQIKEAGERDLIPAAKNIAGAIGGVFAAIKIGQFAKSGIDELKQAAVVDAQTTAQLKARGLQAGITAKQIDELGQSMLELAGFDDEAARSAANVFLRFDRIRGADLFKRIETDAADMAITLGQTLPQAAETLGKALQDPDKAGRLLRDVFGQLTAAEQDAIDKALQHNDIAAAQDVILTKLEGTIGGTAKSYGDTLAGGQDKATESMKNARAELTQGLAPAMELTAKGTQLLAAGIDALPDSAQTAVGAVVILGGGIAAASTTISNAVNIIDKLSSAHKAAAAAAEIQAVAEGEAAAATAAAGATSGFGGLAASAGGLVTVLGPVGIVGAAALAGDALGGLIRHESTAVDVTDQLTAAFELQGDAARRQANEILATALETDTYTKKASEAGVGIDVLARSLNDSTVNFSKLKEAFSVENFLGGGGLEDRLRAAGAETSELGRQLIALAHSGKRSAGDIEGLLDDLIRLSGQQETAKAAALAHATALGGLGGESDGTAQSIEAFTDAVERSARAQQGNLDAARGLFDANRAAESANRGVESALRSQENATRRVTDAQLALNRALRPASAEDIGKANLDISDAHLRVADAAAAVRDAEQQITQFRKDGRHTAEDVADAERALTERQNDYQRALFGVTDAEERLQELQKKGTEQDEAVITARRNLKDAQNDLAASSDAVTEAMFRQAEAQIDVADAQEKLNGGTLTANEALEHQLWILGGLAATLDPNSPLAKNLDSFLSDLAGLDTLFELQEWQAAHPDANIGEGLSLDAGGWVPGPIGAPVRATVHGGEYVISNEELMNGGPGGFGGVHLNGDIIVNNPVPEPASRSVGTELQILQDRAMVAG